MEGSPILSAIRSALDGQTPSASPDPWLAWLVVCLCRHQVKQAWAFERKPQFYHGGLDAGWSYRVDDDAPLIVLEGPASVKIRLPLFGTTPIDIDSALLADEVLAFPEVPFPEARLAYWIPETEFFRGALAQLAQQGLLRASGHGAYRPSPELSVLIEAIVNVDFQRPAVQGLWLKAFGDKRLGRGSPYRTWLKSLAPERPGPALLRALCRVLPDGDAVRMAQKMLTDPGDKTSLAALEILLQNPPDEYRLVERFSHSLDPERHPPELAWAVANLLMRRAEHSQRSLGLAHRFAHAQSVLNSMGNTYDDRWAFFLLEFDTPEMALAQMRRGLLSVIPECARNVAAVLALLDHPWCHKELREVLDLLPSGNRHQSLRYEVGASRQRFLLKALVKSKDPQVRATAKSAQADLAKISRKKGVDRAFQVVQNASGKKLDALFRRALREMAPTARRLRKKSLNIQEFSDAMTAGRDSTAENP